MVSAPQITTAAIYRAQSSLTAWCAIRLAAGVNPVLRIWFNCFCASAKSAANPLCDSPSDLSSCEADW